MKLYYAPGACSLSPHIVLREAGYDFDLEKVDLGAKKTEKGADYNQVHAKSYVPVLELDNGERLTEGVAIVQFLADQKPDSGLAPKAGTFERVRLNEWLNFISAEIHKSFGPFFYGLDDKTKDFYRKKLERSFRYVEDRLQEGAYLMGDRFSVADAYLFTVFNWTKKLQIDTSAFPKLNKLIQRIAERPKVKEALEAEGLTDKAAA